MTVAACREMQMKCSGDLHARITDIKIDLALIKRHLGINGQYRVEPVPTKRDGETDEHHHLRVSDIAIPNVGQVSFPVPPRWLVVLGVGIFLLAGAGLLLIIQTKTDLEQIKKFQTLSNNEAVTGQKQLMDNLGQDHEHIIRKIEP